MTRHLAYFLADHMAALVAAPASWPAALEIVAALKQMAVAKRANFGPSSKHHKRVAAGL